MIEQFYGSLIGTTIPGESGSGINSYESVVHIPQSSRSGASPPDSV